MKKLNNVLLFVVFLIFFSCQKEKNIKEYNKINHIRVIHSYNCSLYTEEIYDCHCEEPNLFSSYKTERRKDTIIYNQIIVDFIYKEIKNVQPNNSKYENDFFNCCFRAFIHYDKTVICVCLGLKGCKINKQLIKDSPLLHLLLKYYSGFYIDYKRNAEVPIEKLPEIIILKQNNLQWEYLK